MGLGYVGLAMAILCSTTKKKGNYKYEVYGLEKKDKKGKKIVNALKNNLLPFEVDDKDFKRNFLKIIKKNILILVLIKKNYLILI